MNIIPWMASLTLVMALMINPARAEPAPGNACSTGQQFLTVGGPEMSGVTHFMVCQGGTWKAMLSANANGEVTKIGNQTCANGDFIKYDGTKIVCVAGAACDSMPATFDFTDAPNVTTSTLTASNILSIVGTDSGCNSTVSVSGDGSPQYQVCSDAGCSSVVQAWTASNMNIAMYNRYLQVRTTSAATNNTASNVTVTVGGVSNVWTVTTGLTGACGASPAVGDVCSDGTVYAGISPDGNRAMYVARCDLGMSWSGSACTGTRTTPTWNDGNTNWTTTSVTSQTQGAANTAALITMDSNSVTGGVQPHNAAAACDIYDDGNGNTDWYLPARNELNVIYENLVDASPNDNLPDPIAPGFHVAGLSYWSSSENTNNGAWLQTFSTAAQITLSKNTALGVRCARRD